MAVPGGAQGGASFECSLTGTVLTGQFRQLYDRLLGLCEHDAHSKMFEHELLFSPADAATATGASSGARTTGGGDVKQAITHFHHDSKTVVSRQYQLCQYGHPEPGRNLVVRSAILVKIHGDAFGFMTLLGYGFEDEFVKRGYNFMYNNICRISVFRKYKLSKHHDAFSAIVPEEETAGGATAEVASPWLVEITSSFVSQENVNSMSDEINLVRNLLAGSVAF
ncbi:hypothetical protein BGW39_006879 [Mortierella sp. 14UC]|nr:hypothetical protein BGW39_006879 [Mortierella sp. 14UC]